ncbi:MAG: hypothetical protein U0324_06525 [Polyangiales bacterium]
MSNTASTFKLPLNNLGPDANDAAWRIAGAQLIKLTRAPLVATLSRNLGPGDEALRARIAAFLETELGTAILTALVSAGLSALPAIPLPGVGTQAVPRLAQELRVKAMADAADFAADLVMGPLRESLSMLILTAGAQPAAALGEAPAVMDFAEPRVVATQA